MNIIKGIDRIALALAVVTLIIVFVGLVHDAMTTKEPNPEYAKWEKKYSDRMDYLYEMNPAIKPKGTINFLEPKKELKRLAALQEVTENDEILQNIKKEEPSKHKHPALLYVLSLSGAIAFISSLSVLFGIRGLTRGIKFFSLWIIEGFKD